MEGTTIEVSHLTKRFGGFTAVHDLSFTVRPGRVTGFLGPNGAGKTTTLRCLLGLVTPTSGTATIGISKPMSRRVPAGSEASWRATMSAVSRVTSLPQLRQKVWPTRAQSRRM